MKKIVFALQVFGTMMTFLLYIFLEMNYANTKSPAGNATLFDHQKQDKTNSKINGGTVVDFENLSMVMAASKGIY